LTLPIRAKGWPVLDEVNFAKLTSLSQKVGLKLMAT
jgi:hypothetical protein